MIRSALALVSLSLAATGRADEPRLEAWAFGGTSLFNVSERLDEVCPTSSCSFQLWSRFDTSVLGGVAVAYRVGRRTSIEGAFSVAPAHDLNVRATADVFIVPLEFRREIAAYHADATCRYDLGLGRTRPFVALGIGRIKYVMLDDLPFRDPASDWAVVVGGGVEIRLGSWLRGRVEVSDHVVPDHLGTDSVGHDVHLRLGVGARF